jgi:hypothetical protein
MKTSAYLLLLAPLVWVSAACEISKSENPLSPSLAGPIPGVEISAPHTLEPGGGAQIASDQQPLTLLLENASSNGPRPLNYVFEVATDAGFTNKVFGREGIQPGENGRTSLRLPDALSTGRTYYWRAKAQDGANTGPYSAPANFVVFTPISFDKPVLRDPVNNEETTNTTPEFEIANAPRTGSPTSVGYEVQVSQSSAFATAMTWVVGEQPNVTRLISPVGLASGTQFFWRARASGSGHEGPWSDTAVFRTPVPTVVAPGPGTGGGGGPISGVSCSAQTSEENVIKCRRAQYGYMSRSQINQFLRAVASDLNSGSFPDKSYGILVKTGGNNCLGYSCDIICSTNGKRWDAMLDSEGAQSPIWLFKGFGNDTCEVQ